MDKRVKQFGDVIAPLLSIPEIFPSIAVEDFPKISKVFEKLLTQEETHTENGNGFCKHFSIGVTYVCGFDIIDIEYADILKIMNKGNETEVFIQYVKSKLKCSKNRRKY